MLPKTLYSYLPKVLHCYLPITTFLIRVDYIGNNSLDFTVTETPHFPVKLINPQKRGDFIFVNATIKGAIGNEFRITYFDVDRIVLLEVDKGKMKNYLIQIK